MWSTVGAPQRAYIEKETHRMIEIAKPVAATFGRKFNAQLDFLGEPADIIQSLSNQLNADLVIVGHSRQKAFALRWWRGSIDAVLLEKIRCSLLVAAGPRQPG